VSDTEEELDVVGWLAQRAQGAQAATVVEPPFWRCRIYWRESTGSSGDVSLPAVYDRDQAMRQLGELRDPGTGRALAEVDREGAEVAGVACERFERWVIIFHEEAPR
jgi:hypothetical protein